MTEPSSGAPGLAVRECGPEERTRQVELFNACFRKRVDAEALAWRYDRSPHGRSVSFLTLAPSGEGVSGYACSPRRALAFGDEGTLATIGETGDVMTHPDWRKRGLFTVLDRAALARTRELGWPLVFGLPNRRSAHIFLELGWKEAGRIRPWSLVLSGGGAVRAELAKEGRLRALGTPFSALRGGSARRALRRAAGGRFRVQALDAFPAEVLELSRQHERDFALMARRDRSWLDWRFLKTPTRAHRAFGVHDETGDFRGYVVVQLPGPDSVVGWIADLLVRGDEARAAAFEGALQALAAAGARIVRAHAIDGSWWAGALAGAGFSAGSDAQALAVIAWVNDPAHPLARAAERAAEWHLTDADRDDETVG